MLLIRQVKPHDLYDILELAHQAGKGMTSLPTSEKTLIKKIEKSLASFSRSEAHPDDFFLLVLEDTEKQKVIGTASIHGRTGNSQAFYAYRVMPVTHYSHSIDTQTRSELLHLTNDYTDCSEVGSLFVSPEYRGNGRWLARSRYLLMGQFQERFAKHVIAELRGIVNTDGSSPFWDAIGRNFFQMEYDQADTLCGTRSNQFITELMPKYPIYTCLLPESARNAIGTPNKDSRRAMDFLEEEGYEYDNVIDIFDGGPIMRAKVEDIKSVRKIEQYTVQNTHAASFNTPLTTGNLTDSIQGTAIVTNTILSDFRIIQSSFHLLEDNTIVLPPQTLDALSLSEGDSVHLIKDEKYS